mmetsp:Transcript_33548/g.105993  ORF Transcript_33548/g.105993 Transcript_33548/m.105993 type:complete len:570 (-) Transcript_33548:409-2118(-)
MQAQASRQAGRGGAAISRRWPLIWRRRVAAAAAGRWGSPTSPVARGREPSRLLSSSSAAAATPSPSPTRGRPPAGPEAASHQGRGGGAQQNLRSVAFGAAALAVTSGAVAYCLGLTNPSLNPNQAPPPDPTGYDAEGLMGAGWKGRVGIRQYMANSPMEDRALASATDDGQLVVGVLDGHGGWQVAEFVQANLLRGLEAAAAAAPSASLSAALTAAFEAMDAQVAELLKPGFDLGFGNVARVGACTTLAVVSESRIVVANAGDCRVVLGRRAAGPHPQVAAEEPVATAATAGATALGPLPASKHSRTCADPRAGLTDMTAAEEKRMPWVGYLRQCKQPEDGSDGGEGGPVPAGGVKAYELSSDHNARVPFEQLKLLREHPFEADIIRCKRADSCYVKGRLQPTRSIGDLYLKKPEFNGAPYKWIWGPRYDRTRGRHVAGGNSWGDSSPAPPVGGTPPYITATPEISRVKREAGHDVVLIAGTDGLWDYLSSQDAVTLATRVLERANGSVGAAAEELREEVLRRAAAKHGLSMDEVRELTPGRERRVRHDDITIVVVDLRQGGKSRTAKI